MQFFKVNCNRTVGNAKSQHTHFVTATAESDAIAAVVSDAQSEGDSCADWQVIPIQSEVLVGS